MIQMSQISLRNIWAYITGNIRYWLYWNHNKLYKFFVRDHIREQIAARINSMNKECFARGACIKCGCATTNLQYASKACDGDCYPNMLSAFGWELLKHGLRVIDCNTGIRWELERKGVNDSCTRFIKINQDEVQ